MRHHFPVHRGRGRRPPARRGAHARFAQSRNRLGAAGKREAVTRRILRALLIAVVVIGVPAVFIRGGSRVALDDLISVARRRVTNLPELVQRIRDFHRVVTRNGQRLLEVSAKEARYFRDETAVEIIEPKIVFFDAGQPVAEIAGGQGRIVLDGNDVAAVSLRGAVRLRLADFELETAELAYDRKAERIEARGPSVIRSQELTLRGSGITVDLSAQTLRVARDVRMELRKSSAPEKERS
ncbi:MAG: LPS export ABC transporter periplasmic protein LptC [Candidatus Dadabacteria bacterium]|nr:MAG: LPS export ABC transporter periplasmic protein LptC [Candidatus Dadabacteria bacterium]